MIVVSIGSHSRPIATTYMFQEVGTHQTLLANCILSLLLTGVFQFSELQTCDATIVVLVPILVVPRPAQGQELVLSQLQRV